VIRALVVWLILAPSLAHADAHDEAVVLFDQAMKDMKAGDYTKACKGFAISLERWPDSGTKGSLAICYTSLGKVATAWQLWRELSDTAPTPQLRADAIKKAQKLEGRLPHYVAKLKAPTPGLVVTVNGGRIDPSLGVPVPIDPGKLTVTAEAVGYDSWTQDLTAAESQTTTIEVPQLTKSKTAPKTTTPSLEGGATKATFIAELKPGGGSVDGAFRYDDQLDGYWITVRAGARVKLEITHGGTKMGLDTLLYVYGPNGTAGYPASSLYSDDDGGWGKLSKIAAASFSEAGKYAVVVAAKNKTRGNYRLVVTCLSGQCEPEVTAGPVTPPNGNTGDIIAPPPPNNDDVARSRSRRHLIAFGVGTLGLGGLGAAGFFGLQASSKYDDAKKTCGGAITSCDPSKLPTAQKQVSDARSAATLSTIGFAAGGALVATSIVIYLTAPKVVENNTVKVTPVVGGGTVGVAFGLRF
jgi:hypothetical protein